MEAFQALSAKLSQIPGLEVRAHEPMAHHTTFRVGGPAALMALPKRLEELSAVLRAAAEAGIVPFFLGKGSNLLVADEGVDRFLIKLAGGLTRLERDGETGLYLAHGIPGTVGGGVFMNAGAYDGEMAQVIDWVDCLDETGAAHRLGKDELKLGYRTSVFSQLPWSIVGAHLTLTTGDETAIREKMADLAQRRRSKQPLEYPSAGSTFKRPVGHFAGGLIEQCGLKGTKVGGAQVSEKHAGFVINAGGATCRDILALIRLVRATVLEQTGVTLEPEVRLLGCALDEES